MRNWVAAEPSWVSGESPRRRQACCPVTWRAGTASSWVRHRLRLGVAGPPRRRPVGLDNSAAQLATARHLQDRFGLRFPLIHASAEQAPFADASFDLAISEYGSSIWCDPFTWIPEAARLLRPGGQLIFLVNSVLLSSPSPAPMISLPPIGCCGRISACTSLKWPGDESVEFHLGHSDIIRLLRGCGLEVEDLPELRPEPGAATRYPFVTLEWGPAMAVRRSLESPQILLN